MTTSGRNRAQRSAQGVRITDRDLTLLHTLTRYGYSTATTLLRTTHAGRHRSGVYAQLARLSRVALIEDLRTGPSNQCRPRNVHALLVPTRLAYTVVASGLSYMAPALGTMLHTLAVAEVGLLYQVAGYEVITDREIRAEAAAWRLDYRRALKAREPLPPVPTDATWIMAADARPGNGHIRTHCPDLVVLGEDGMRFAVEVELTPKNDRDLRAIVEAFDRTSTYAAVTYYTPHTAVANRVTTMVEKTAPSLAPRLYVRRYDPAHSVAL